MDHGDQGCQKRALSPLKLELHMVVIFPVGAEFSTQVPWQEKQVRLSVEPSL